MRDFLFNLIFILTFVLSNQIFAQHISFTSSEINAGESVVVEMLLDNPQDISGFQFQILDLPDQGAFTNISGTERTGTFMINFNEQPDGSVIVIGFSLTGDVIAPGDGSILSLTYQSTGQFSSEVNLSLIQEVSILSDQYGLPIEFTYTPGMIIINGEAPPPVIAIENLSAVGGFGEVSLSWIDPNTIDISGYHIFRDGGLIGNSTI